MKRASLGSLHHASHSAPLFGRSHCLHPTNGETRPERMNTRVRAQSPCCVKFSKWGSKERWSASKLTRRGDQHEKKQTQQWWNLIQPNSQTLQWGVWKYHSREHSEMINFHNAPKSSSRGQTVFHVLSLERQGSAGFKTWLVEWLHVVVTTTDMERRSQYVAIYKKICILQFRFQEKQTHIQKIPKVIITCIRIFRS